MIQALGHALLILLAIVGLAGAAYDQFLLGKRKGEQKKWQ